MCSRTFRGNHEISFMHSHWFENLKFWISDTRIEIKKNILMYDVFLFNANYERNEVVSTSISFFLILILFAYHKRARLHFFPKLSIHFSIQIFPRHSLHTRDIGILEISRKSCIRRTFTICKHFQFTVISRMSKSWNISAEKKFFDAMSSRWSLLYYIRITVI